MLDLLYYSRTTSFTKIERVEVKIIIAKIQRRRNNDEAQSTRRIQIRIEHKNI